MSAAPAAGEAGAPTPIGRRNAPCFRPVAEPPTLLLAPTSCTVLSMCFAMVAIMGWVVIGGGTILWLFALPAIHVLWILLGLAEAQIGALIVIVCNNALRSGRAAMTHSQQHRAEPGARRILTPR